MDLDKFLSSPFKSCIFESEVHKNMKAEPIMISADEAGRGCVLGPMVYGSAYYPISIADEMAKIGFADSKALTIEQREKLFKKINSMPDKIGWIANVLSPNLISNSMFKRCKYNLNELSHDTVIGLIKRIKEAGVMLKEVYIDTVGPPEKYQQKLKRIFPELDIVVSKKADSLYPVVSAASICAKVIRDRCLNEWKYIEKLDKNIIDFDYGSGYPGDPKTKAYLEKSLNKIFGFSSFIRFSWSTAFHMLDNKAIKCNWYEENEDADTQPIENFFKKNKKVPKTNKFLQSRNVERVSDFN